MDFEKLKITDEEIETNGLCSAADSLNGTARENKERFDKLPKLIIERHNSFIDECVKAKSEIDNAGYITDTDIPKKLSDFENDTGYITESSLPKKLSEIENDTGYITESAIPEKISGFENDVGYITESAIPKKVSEFENDKGYITESSLPKKVSELENDKGYITDDNSCYDTVINSQEEWDAMVATADWNGARNILLKASIRIQIGTTDKQGTLKIPLNVQSIDGNHNGIMVFNTDIEPVETYSSRVCLFNFAPLQLIRSKCSYIKSMHHCSLNVIQSSSIQYSANIVNCSASFSDDSTLEVCDTILLDTVSMSLIKNREHEVLANCTNIIYEKTKLSEFNNDEGYITQTYVDDLVGNIDTVLDELHTYAQNLVDGGASE